jgi:quinol monooxygenase YgiN
VKASLVLARLSIWNFKKGKREEGFAELDRILNSTTRHTKGFRGYISLISRNDQDSTTILTLWQDGESLEASEKGVYSLAIEQVQDYLESPPQVKSFRVFSTELFTRSELEKDF